MKKSKKQIIAEHLFEGHSCENCNKCYQCKLSPTNSVCEKWEELVNPLLKMVRLTYPNLISNKLVSVQPMEQASDNIHYIDVKFEDDQEYKVAMHMSEWMNSIKSEGKDEDDENGNT